MLMPRTLASKMADAVHCRTPASSQLSFLIICAILKVININCKANSISRKCQDTVKEGQGHVKSTKAVTK